MFSSWGEAAHDCSSDLKWFKSLPRSKAVCIDWSDQLFQLWIYLVQVSKVGWYKSRLYSRKTSSIKHLHKYLIMNFIKPFLLGDIYFFSNSFPTEVSIDFSCWNVCLWKANSKTSCPQITGTYFTCARGRVLARHIPMPSQTQEGNDPTWVIWVTITTEHSWIFKCPWMIMEVNDSKKQLLKKLDNWFFFFLTGLST